MESRLQEAMKHGSFWVTKRIAIGRFASKERCAWLLEEGVTHVLNVGDAPSQEFTRCAGFRHVADIPIADLERLPLALALRCIGAVHDIMAEPGTKLHVHCTAGQNRSPTVLWLYMVACGMDVDAARLLITEESPDSVPGHERLVDELIVSAVQEYGLSRRLAPEDPDVLEPAY